MLDGDLAGVFHQSVKSTTPPAAPRGRGPRGPRAEGDSRAEILAAARTLFAAKGFRATTTREIAARAGVDPALIHHFFGTKADLFEATVQLPRIAGEVGARLEAPSGDAAEGLARLYVEELFTRDVETFAAMLRTAVSSPEDMPWLRQMMEDTMLAVATRLLRGEHVALRAELIGAQMIGILVLRHLVGVEPIASTSTDDLVAAMAPALRALIDGAA